MKFLMNKLKKMKYFKNINVLYIKGQALIYSRSMISTVEMFYTLRGKHQCKCCMITALQKVFNVYFKNCMFEM